MPTLTHPKGRTVTVPDESVEYYTEKGWSLDGAPASASSASDTATGDVVVIPEGDPSSDWKAAQFEAFAEREGIDLSKAKNNPGRLKAITAAIAIPEGEPSAEWTLPQLRAAARRDEVSLDGITEPGDIIAALTAE